MSEYHDDSHVSDTELRVRTLESLLVDKGIVDPDFMTQTAVMSEILAAVSWF